MTHASKHAQRMAKKRGMNPDDIKKNTFAANLHGLMYDDIPDLLRPYAASLLAFFEQSEEWRTKVALAPANRKLIIYNGWLYVLSATGKLTCITFKPLPEDLCVQYKGAVNRKSILNLLWDQAKLDGIIRSF